MNIFFWIAGIAGFLTIVLILKTGMMQLMLSELPWFKILVIFSLLVIIWRVW